MLRILFFGELKDVAGCSESLLEAPANSELLWQALVQKWPGLGSKTFTIAINHKVQREQVPLKDGDEIALMPPFSGG